MLLEIYGACIKACAMSVKTKGLQMDGKRVTYVSAYECCNVLGNSPVLEAAVCVEYQTHTTHA